MDPDSSINNSSDSHAKSSARNPNNSSSRSSSDNNSHNVRSKSLASASSIVIDATGSQTPPTPPTSQGLSTKQPTSRSSVAPRSPGAYPKEPHNIKSSIRSNRAPSLTSIKILDSKNISPEPAVFKRFYPGNSGNSNNSSNFIAISTPSRIVRGTSSHQQQPAINIISNPNFEQTPRSSISMEVTANNTTESSSLSPQATKSNNENSIPKPKRNTTSLSASLRRLITITFSRNPTSPSQSGSVTNGNPSSSNRFTKNGKTATNKRQKSDKPSLYKQNGNKRKPFISRASMSSSGQAELASPRAQQTNTYETIVQRIETSRKSSLQGQPAILPTTSLANSDELSGNQAKRKPDGETEKLPSPPWTPPTNADVAEIDGNRYIECPLCVLLVSESSTPHLESCRHRVCLECMQRYITTEINHSRLNITCPVCSEPIHPNTIKEILQNEKYYLKYESFMLRRVLAAEPDARWCPAPDCGYVVLATGCASCPKLVCGREGCNTSFCYHCKQEWHPNQTCSAASIQRNKRMFNAYNIGDLIEESAQSSSTRKSSKSSQQATSIRADDIRECPVCTSRIIKMNDGSCNHMKCSICETEFCWLCMKEISDLHYFSPSGCTFWGKKPWSRKKKLLWQLGMLVGAPICIILIAGIAVPAIVIGIPVWAARKLHNRLERKPFSIYRKNAIITGGVLLSFMVSPIISAITLAIGIPILLGYVYGVVPLSLCRSSGGCLSSAPSLENLQQEIQAARNTNIHSRDGISIDTAMSHKLGDPSIGETSLYMSNISLENVEREDRESASNAALAGSIISQNVDDGNSTRALAGSIISKESGYTLIPVEVHSSSLAAASTLNNATNNPSSSVATEPVTTSTAGSKSLHPRGATSENKMAAGTSV